VKANEHIYLDGTGARAFCSHSSLDLDVITSKHLCETQLLDVHTSKHVNTSQKHGPSLNPHPFTAFFHFNHLKAKDWKRLKNNFYQMDPFLKIKVIKNRHFLTQNKLSHLSTSHSTTQPLDLDVNTSKHVVLDSIQKNTSKSLDHVEGAPFHLQGPTCICMFPSMESFQKAFALLENHSCILLGIQYKHHHFTKLDFQALAKLDTRVYGYLLNTLARRGQLQTCLQTQLSVTHRVFFQTQKTLQDVLQTFGSGLSKPRLG
jgi:hypothetical protein